MYIVYEYEAMTPAGDVIQDFVLAKSADDAKKNLSGLFVTKLNIASPISQIDAGQLLKKYMQHVNSCGKSTFIDQESEIKFTKEERRQLFVFLALSLEEMEKNRTQTSILKKYFGSD